MVDGIMAAFGLKKLSIVPSFFCAFLHFRCAVLQTFVLQWCFSRLGSLIIP